MLRLADHWVWDSWTAFDGQRHHLFFLRASRALGDPEKRHRRASIGHAVSSDLRDWELRPDALVAADAPAPDDLATWTGSVARGDDGVWHLFYTGVSRVEDGLVQRILRATSPDLEHWTRSGLVLEADARWYEKLGSGAWYDESWRDPFVLRDPEGRGWHMLVTARAAAGDPAGRGVVGHAFSPDLESWEIRPPLTTPFGFGQLEVVQAQLLDDGPALVFSCRSSHMSSEAAPGLARTGGGWVLPGESLLGPFDPARLRPIGPDELYATRAVRDVDGRWALLGFVEQDGDGFGGWIPDPLDWRATTIPPEPPGMAG